MKRSALGRGISALIPEAAGGRAAGVTEIAVADLRPNPLQPRRTFGEEGLAELASSIQRHGLLQPVIVCRAPEGGYHLIAGERRWRAARLAGMERIAVVVREAADDSEELTLALIENLQREDLTPIEEARAYHHLRVEVGLSQEDIASRVGRQRSTVANSLRLLQLPLSVQERVDAGTLSAGHARSLAGLEDAERQELLAERCVRESWSVRALEAHLRPGAPRTRRRTADPETAAAAERLSRSLGSRVVIHRRRRGGEIRISFASEEELIRLFKRLAKEKR